MDSRQQHVLTPVRPVNGPLAYMTRHPRHVSLWLPHTPFNIHPSPNIQHPKKMSSYCQTCNRFFPNSHAIDQHLRTSTRHGWCERCQRSFNSPAAKERHVADSSYHHVYPFPDCPPRADFRYQDDLDTHQELYHFFCRYCREYYTSAASLSTHLVVVHHRCEDCGLLFETRQNLQAVCNIHT